VMSFNAKKAIAENVHHDPARESSHILRLNTPLHNHYGMLGLKRRSRRLCCPGAIHVFLETTWLLPGRSLILGTLATTPGP
jgi:hypothetical protein